MEIISKTDELSSLLKAVDQAGLEETLKGERPMTFFAPNNEAFNKLPTKVKDMNTEELTKLLKRHVVFGTVKAIDIKEKGRTLETAADDKIEVRKEASEVIVEFLKSKAKVVGAETIASNGLIHIINTVLTGEIG